MMEKLVKPSIDMKKRKQIDITPTVWHYILSTSYVFEISSFDASNVGMLFCDIKKGKVSLTIQILRINSNILR